jgi:hypothetical protein
LESSLSIEELLATIKAIYAREDRSNKFQASLQGIDLDEKVEEVQDITSLSGYSASKAGFGIGVGLGHVTEG